MGLSLCHGLVLMGPACPEHFPLVHKLCCIFACQLDPRHDGRGGAMILSLSMLRHRSYQVCALQEAAGESPDPATPKQSASGSRYGLSPSHHLQPPSPSRLCQDSPFTGAAPGSPAPPAVSPTPSAVGLHPSPGHRQVPHRLLHYRTASSNTAAMLQHRQGQHQQELAPCLQKLSIATGFALDVAYACAV